MQIINDHVEQEISKGWVCPKCNNSVSPNKETCPICTKEENISESNKQDKTILRR